MRSLSAIGRVAAVGALIAAVVLVALVLFGNGGAGGYKVHARFLNAGQLVKGNPVQVGGVPVGSVKGIKITDDGHAEIELSIDGDHSPLRRGTRAEIRQFSQSGLANRYVDLKLPPDTDDTIPDGGVIDTDSTVTQVDLDELYNTLDPETRKSLQGFFKGSADQWRGREREANVGFQYLNPALSTSSRLFNELTKDTPVLERFLVDSSRMVTALADRRDDLAGLIGNLNDHHARARQPEGGARRVDRPSPAVHAPCQHDVRGPALHPRRGRPARRGLEAGGEAPAALPLAGSGLRRRRRADGARPQHHDPQAGRLERPDQPPALLPAAGRDRHGHEAARLRARRPQPSTWARRAAPSRSPSTRSRAAPARSALPARTPPTSSAGSTTSRPPAAASTRSAPPLAA